MKKLKTSSLFMFTICLVLFMTLGLSSSATAKAKVVKFVAAGGNEGGQEVSAEMMALNMYMGALDYRVRTYHVLKGKYKIKWITTLFPDADECLTGVASGAAEITFSSPHFMEQMEPAWKAVEAPGVFNSWGHFMKTMNTPEWKALQDKMAEEKGVKIIKWMANIGNHYLFSNKGPINTLEDLKGQKIRYPGGEAFAKVLKAMKTTPIAMPYTEVVTALQTNMFDGLLTDWFGAMYFYNLPRYTKYSVNVTWGIQPICMVVNNDWWKSLPAEERTAMQDVFDRIDTSQFFEGAQSAIAGGWNANPATELINLSESETAKWKKVMLKGSESVLKSLDPKLVQAIESSR